MIQFDSRYFNNAHRVSLPLAAAVGTFHDGQWMTLNSDGELILSTGATNKHSYITISSRYGTGNAIGAPITDAPAGRDTVSISGLAIVLIGPYALVTDQYETGSYTMGAALKVSANGKLDTWVAGTDKNEDIVGYVSKVPAAGSQTIGIIHE